MNHPLGKRLVVEAVGTAMLLAAVVGSGIMGERLAGGNVAITLLANAIATGCALVALITAFGPISGAHFNPVVTLASAWQRSLPWREAPAYVLAQTFGAFAGVAVAHLMFQLPLFFASRHVRNESAHLFSEFVATFGLVVLILVCSRVRPSAVPVTVAAYIVAAYWFTFSTSFANPAVTLARSATDTFTGIRPLDAPAFILAQAAGAATATLFFRWLHKTGTENSMSERKRVLFLCTGNSARSQMAEGLLRHMDGDRFQVASAGVAPTSVRPEALEVMRELDIDISDQRSKSVDEFVGQEFDYVITVCDNANEQCPVFPGKTTRVHWSFDDPAALEGDSTARLGMFRRVRDEIHQRLRDFVMSPAQ